MKSQKGITLIALIITIIVLLILAGVSISLVVGDNGLLTQAQESKVNTEKAQQQEYKQLTIAHAGMNLEGYTDEKTGVYIPSGFAVSENPKEQKVNDGLVVIDKFGDEFVWISATADNFKKKKSGKNYEMDVSNITSIIDDYGNNPVITTNAQEVANVTTAGGFFVSRYEIGANRECEGDENIDYKTAWVAEGADKTAIVNSLKSKINSKPGYEPVRVMTWDECLALSNNWKIGKDYQSGLITGTTWDRMVSFICDDNTSNETFDTREDEKNISNYDSKSWGNYYNNPSTTYKQIFRASDAGRNWQLQTSGRVVESDSSKFVFPTGEFISSEGVTTAKKNVYDVAGNVWEWTTEISTSNNVNRVIRGGSTGNLSNVYPATSRFGYYASTKRTGWNVGFRVVLYVINPNNP